MLKFTIHTHVLSLLVFGLTDIGFLVKNIDINLYMYIGFYPYTICFKVILISSFCIYMCFGENGFPFQNLSLENTDFVFKPNFISQK